MQSEKMLAFAVPTDIEPTEIQALAEALREAAASSAFNGSIKLTQVHSRGVEGPGANDMLLLISSAASVWITKKWADEYLWPAFKRRLDSPSKKLVAWLERTLASLGHPDRSNDDSR